MKFESILGMTSRHNTANDAFEYLYKTLSDIASKTSEATSRDGAVAAELINTTTIILDPTRNLITSKIRNMSNRYAIGEFLWYLSGSNLLSNISQYSPAWEKLSDNGKTVNSAYGYRINTLFGFNQLDYVYNLLKADKNSRQAVIHIKDASCRLSNDVPCTVALQYFIRDGMLHATTYMRSNDIWLGFPYDVFSFTCLQTILAMRLGVPVGTYTHFTGSLHLYSRNLVRDNETDKKGSIPPAGVNLVPSESEMRSYTETMNKCLYSHHD